MEVEIIIYKENPDRAQVERVRNALALTEGYCPCAIERSPDTKCPCKEFREQESGMCHCGLYMKEEDN